MTDRGTAQIVVGSYLSTLAADAGEPGRVYWDEVIGVKVTSPNGELIGTVFNCYRTGGAEVYILRTPDGGELDLPVVDSIIVTFKPREGIIIADLSGSELSVRAPLPPRAPKPPRTPKVPRNPRQPKSGRAK